MVDKEKKQSYVRLSKKEASKSSDISSEKDGGGKIMYNNHNRKEDESI